MPDDGGDDEERSALRPDESASYNDGSALAPDDLDIEDDEYVVSLDEDRYVIGTDERPDVPADAKKGASGETSNSSATDAADDGSSAVEASAADSGAVKQVLEDDLQGVSARYGFHVTAKSEEAISHQQMFSDDVGTVFDSLLRWYAQQLTTETAVEDVLGILLTESNVRVRYSPSCLQAILEAYDLGPDDTIADLFETVQDDRGMVFPPENV
jgi:hypothetical protein